MALWENLEILTVMWSQVTCMYIYIYKYICITINYRFFNLSIKKTLKLKRIKTNLDNFPSQNIFYAWKYTNVQNYRKIGRKIFIKSSKFSPTGALKFLPYSVFNSVFRTHFFRDWIWVFLVLFLYAFQQESQMTRCDTIMDHYILVVCQC